MKDILGQIKEFLRRTWIPVVVILVVIIAGVASIEVYREEVLEVDPDIELIESKEINLLSEELDTLNPIISQSEDVYYISKLIYNSLFDFNKNMNVVQELVDNYQVDTEAGKITIDLKKKAKWHDGSNLTAEDVRFTVDAIRYAGKNSVYFDKISTINYVTVTGESSLEIVFKKKSDAALDNLTFPIVAKSSFTSVADAAKNKEYKPVGTGQYKYKAYNYLKKLVLVPNDQYFGNVGKKTINVNISPDRDLASELQQINSVSCYIDGSSERKLNAEDKELKVYDIPSNEAEIIVFNTQNKFLEIDVIRKAVAHSIDLNKVLENGYMNDGVLADTVYYPNFMNVSETGDNYSYDLTAVKTLLKGIGFEDKDANGIIEDGENNEVSFKIVVNKNNSTRLAAARLVEDQMEDAGFKVELVELSWEDYETAVKKRDFDILFTGYAFEERYDLRFLFNGKNEWKYKNEDILEKAEQLEELHTIEEYKEIYSELKNILVDEVPYYCLCYRQIGLVGGKYFEAESMPIYNDIYRNIDSWSSKYEKPKAENDESE